MKMKNKKSMSISIVILVIATLVLTIVSLFAFNIRGNNISAKISLANLDNVYVIEDLVNFYVYDMIENSIEDGMSEEKFIENLKREFNKYKQGDDFVLEELRQIESQINKENIEIEKINSINKKVSITLEIDVLDNILDNNKEIAFITYNYKKAFEKDL